jgi:hypothetical protein
MEPSLIVELIHRTKGVLGTIDKLTQLSQGKFGDREFGEFFFKAVAKDIESHNVLLNAFLKYIESTALILKKGTVNKLIEEALKKNQAHLEERGARAFKNCEEGLPETVVPDEQLRFILDSLLQCAMDLMPLGGLIELITRSVVLPGASIGDKEPFKKNGKYIEIGIIFTRGKGPVERSPRGRNELSGLGEASSDLIYKLVEVVVKRSQGTMKLEADERESKNTIYLRLPIERRKVVYYQQQMNKGNESL